MLSVKVREPQFEGQTKTKLGNSEVEGTVKTVVNEMLGGVSRRASARGQHRRSRKPVGGAGARGGAQGARPHAQEERAERRRAAGQARRLLAERPGAVRAVHRRGRQAGGSAKMGRDRSFQAILPLRGKILNVERARIDKVLSNEEIRTIITALGTGIGDDFSIDKARYHKIILMTDADVDGAHIRTLLLTFFFRQMPSLIDAGFIYIAQPPLFRVAQRQGGVLRVR